MVKDIYYALESHYADSIESLGVLKYIKENCKKGSMLRYELKKFIHDKSLDFLMCPECLRELTPKREVVNIHSHLEGNNKEYHTILICESCGEKYE